MDPTKQHYDAHLAERYTWAFGGHEANRENNRNMFDELGLKPGPDSFALDLGAGSGFQSIPLLKLGFNVVAVDLCEALLDEIWEHWTGPQLETVCADARDIKPFADRKYRVITCMGDTISHFASLAEVERLIVDARNLLEPRGKLILSYRDLSNELTGTDRFIPVRTSPDRIFTCFLEYNENTVTVNDIIYELDGGNWTLHKSAYKKIKIPKAWLTKTLRAHGYTILHDGVTRGMQTIVAAP